MQKQLGVVDTKLVDVESGLPEVHWSVVKDIDNEQTKGEKDQRSYMRRVVCSKSSLLLVLLFLLAFSSYLAGQTPKHASRSVVVESHSEDWSDSADSIAQQSIVNNEIVGSIEEPTENANVVDETRDDDSINDSASQYSFYFMLNPQLEEAKVKSVEATDRLNKYVDYLNEPLQDDEFATLKSLIIAKAKANKVLLVIWLRTMGVAENKIAELEKYPESEMSDDTVYRVIRQFFRSV